MTAIKENQAVRVKGQVYKVLRLMKVNCQLKNLATGEIVTAKIEECQPLLQAIKNDFKAVKKKRIESRKQRAQEKFNASLNQLKTFWAK
jgi:hypothetical protein